LLQPSTPPTDQRVEPQTRLARALAWAGPRGGRKRGGRLKADAGWFEQLRLLRCNCSTYSLASLWLGFLVGPRALFFAGWAASVRSDVALQAWRCLTIDKREAAMSPMKTAGVFQFCTAAGPSHCPRRAQKLPTRSPATDCPAWITPLAPTGEPACRSTWMLAFQYSIRGRNPSSPVTYPSLTANAKLHLPITPSPNCSSW